ncbi:unnamed protein product [Dovyalis caffra]|uniref:Uncharacterized protein n=1 Tax=Dovyalis caffra TaxID=77055 RepID=A0AAV1QV74_9ROSI|nr:unnamed protein product [Dovyalis caffra]
MLAAFSLSLKPFPLLHSSSKGVAPIRNVDFENGSSGKNLHYPVRCLPIKAADGGGDNGGAGDGNGSGDSFGGGGGGGRDGGDSEEDKEFGPILKFEDVMKEKETRGVELPADMLEAAKSAGIIQLFLLRSPDLQFLYFGSAWPLGFVLFFSIIRSLKKSEKDIPVPARWGVFLSVSSNRSWQIITGQDRLVGALSLAKQALSIAITHLLEDNDAYKRVIDVSERADCFYWKTTDRVVKVFARTAILEVDN